MTTSVRRSPRAESVQDRKRQIIDDVTSGLMAVCLLGGASLLFLPIEELDPWLPLLGGSALIILGALVLNAHEMPRTAGVVLIAGLWALIIGTSVTGHWCSVEPLVYLPTLVVLGSLLFGATVVVGLSITFVVSLVMIALLSYLNVFPPWEAVSPTTLVVTYSIALALVAHWIFLGARAQAESYFRRRGSGLKPRPSEAAARKLSAMIESANDAIVGTDLKGKIISWNRGAERVYGWRSDEILGRSVLDFVNIPEAPSMIRSLAASAAGETIPSLEAVHLRHDGSPMRVSVVLSPIVDSVEGVVGASLVVRAIPKNKSVDTLGSDVFRRLAAAADIAGIGVWEWNVDEPHGKADEVTFRVFDIEPHPEGILLYDEWAARLHPDDRAKTEALLKTTIKERSRTRHEYRVITRGGQVRHILGTQAMTSDTPEGPLRMVGMTIDITEAKETEEALHESLRHLRNANMRLTFHASRMPLAFIVWDREFRVTEWNSAATRIFGWSSSEVIGRHAYEFLVPSDLRSLVNGVWQDLLAGGSFGEHSVNDNITKSGKRIKCEWFNVPLRDADGEISGCLCMVNDVTDRNRAENERLKLEARLHRSQKLQALGTLSSGIAHDFNNLLAAIGGNLELALTRLDPKDSCRRYLEQISKAHLRASELVNRILTFTREREPKREQVRLEMIADEVVNLLKPTLPPNIEVKLLVDGRIPPIFGDSSQLHQVVVNLCTNAAHAMVDTGGTLQIEVSESYLGTLERVPHFMPGQYVCLSVSDTGCGMDDATAERIFEPFFTTKNAGLGTGLGLSVVHGIVESHRGFISTSSGRGDGTRMDLYFPVSELPEHSTVERVSKSPAVLHGRILIVEDEEALASLFDEIVSGAGFHVSVFTSATAAISEFLRDPLRYDVLVTDLSMPELNGLQLAARIHHSRPDLPIVLTTGFLNTADSELAKKSGIGHVVLKPAVFPELLTVIASILGGGSSSAESTPEVTQVESP